MALKPCSFFATQDFDAAWRCYSDWCAFQRRLNLEHQVELAGCRINGHICWDVRITQRLHDIRVACLDAAEHQRSGLDALPYRWVLLLAVPLAFVSLCSLASLPSSQYEPSGAEVREEEPTARRGASSLRQ